MRFLDNCSWMRITFSVPRVMKYPPGSSGHSFILANSGSLLSYKLHLFDLSIMGSRPMTKLLRMTLWLPRFFKNAYFIKFQKFFLYMNGDNEIFRIDFSF
ncbi:hypothetical protein BpHYR1_015325 [Brachionus plicatilis]|uniref:Uncharacterized protein n=1 Tax=Brachionus plicatilis TaxID=10195 RepID=A0A3M7RGM9_BRAPC|nr:hypothetical protein BpHYR1_015325 [Brachionus plicatilis]